MTIVEILLLLLIAAVCGALAQAISGYSSGGLLVTIVVGFIGALLGSWLARAMELPIMLGIEVGGQTFPVIWSIIGGALFCAVIAMLTRRPRVIQ